MAKELLFSLTKKDFDVQYYRASGPGGQKVNKTSSACRIRHPASGAAATCQEHRSQFENKEQAFKRLLASPTFKMWHAQECRRRMGQQTLEQQVEEQMAPKNLKVEVFTDGEWGPLTVL